MKFSMKFTFIFILVSNARS